jgi:hypothetical protein
VERPWIEKSPVTCPARTVGRYTAPRIQVKAYAGWTMTSPRLTHVCNGVIMMT